MKDSNLEEKNRILQKIVFPFRVEFKPKDALQVIIGATILAIPLGYTEETWVLGSELPLSNVFALLLISIIFIAAFVYYNYYKNTLRKNLGDFFKRTVLTYVLSFFVVALLLTIIQKAPWNADFILAFKRVVIVAFPSSMSATVADIIK